MIRLIVAALLLVVCVLPAVADVLLGEVRSDSWFTCHLDSLGATLTECQPLATLGTGERYYITDIVVQTAVGAADVSSVSTSAAGATQAPVVTGVAGSQILLSELVLFSSAAGTTTVTVAISGGPTLNLGTISFTTAPQIITLNYLTPVGSSITVNIGAIATITTTVSIVATRQASAGQYSIQAVNCATATVAIFPQSATTKRFNAPTLGQPTPTINFGVFLRLPVGNAICVIGTLTNTINVQIHGFRSSL
jgi:hypothetical protein